MVEPEGGLLIVNADDYGRVPQATDLTLTCFEDGQITSTTAMVWMVDSDRAAELARQTELPVGLHLNLSEGFTDAAVPAAVRARQARLVRRFAPDRGRQLLRWVYDPRIQADVEGCIADQLHRFSELYGRAPTHLDGHQHVHLSPNVLFASGLAATPRLRGALETAGGRPSQVRRLRQRAIERRFQTTERFLDIADVDPRRTPALALAGTSSLEVMCHPAFAHEHERLASPEWTSALRAYRTGSFEDLAG